MVFEGFNISLHTLEAKVNLTVHEMYVSNMCITGHLHNIEHLRTEQLRTEQNRTEQVLLTTIRSIQIYVSVL